MGRQQRRMGGVKRTAVQTARGGTGRSTLQAVRGGAGRPTLQAERGGAGRSTLSSTYPTTEHFAPLTTKKDDGFWSVGGAAANKK